MTNKRGAIRWYREVFISISVITVVATLLGCVAISAATVKTKKPVLKTPAAPTTARMVFIPTWTDLPVGTVGKPYAGFSFCSPAPKPGAFCGKVLPSNPETTNPHHGKPNYTFKSSVSLPFGLSLNLNGNLTGKPTKAGTYSFKICATDRVGTSQCQPATIVVNEAEQQAAAPSSDLGVKAWPLLVRADTLPAVIAMTNAGPEYIDYYRAMELKSPTPLIFGDPIQKMPCYTTKGSGEAYGLCGGTWWQFKSPLGCEISLHALPVKFEAAKQETSFSISLTGMPCWEDGKASAWSAKRVEIVKSEHVGAGLKATLRIYYDENVGGSAVEKAMPDFTLAIGALTKYED